MKKEFVPYELAVKLKELGFDEPCFARFRKGDFQLNTLGKPIEHNSQQIVIGDVSAPLWQQSFDWFREKYGLISVVGFQNDYLYSYEIYSIILKDCVDYIDSIENYEQARHACLEKLIELIQNKNDRSI